MNPTRSTDPTGTPPLTRFERVLSFLFDRPRAIRNEFGDILITYVLCAIVGLGGREWGVMGMLGLGLKASSWAARAPDQDPETVMTRNDAGRVALFGVVLLLLIGMWVHPPGL